MNDQITTRDLYETQLRTDGKVDAIGLQVATFTARVETRLDHGDNAMTDHEKRIRVLEAFRWKLLGAAVLVSGIASAAVSWVISHH